jgi:hypothetical protein
MEGRKKPDMEKYKEVRKVWNYYVSYMLTLLPILDLENLSA